MLFSMLIIRFGRYYLMISQQNFNSSLRLITLQYHKHQNSNQGAIVMYVIELKILRFDYLLKEGNLGYTKNLKLNKCSQQYKTSKSIFFDTLKGNNFVCSIVKFVQKSFNLEQISDLFQPVLRSTQNKNIIQYNTPKFFYQLFSHILPCMQAEKAVAKPHTYAYSIKKTKLSLTSYLKKQKNRNIGISQRPKRQQTESQNANSGSLTLRTSTTTLNIDNDMIMNQKKALQQQLKQIRSELKYLNKVYIHKSKKLFELTQNCILQ